MTIDNIDEIVETTLSRTNIILDATLLTTLMSCPRLSDFRFNHHFQPIGGKSNSLECGSIVHTFLEVYYHSIIIGLDRNKAFSFAMAAAELYISGCRHCSNFVPSTEIPRTDCDHKFIDSNHCLKCGWKPILKPECGHKPNEYPGVTNTPKESEGFKTGWRWVLETCDQYNQFYRNDHWVPLETEVVKGKILYEDEEIRILWKAKLDLTADTNQGIYPIDHKTMKQRRDSVSLNNQFIGQCLVMGTRTMIKNEIGFQTSLKPEEKFVRQPMSYSANRLIEWQAETLPYYAKLLMMYSETGHFPPNYTACEGKYGKCNFVKVCESDPGMREEMLKQHFIVGQPWNPSNDIPESE